MGTRCDFYIGMGPSKLRWLGSYPFDGYPEGAPKRIAKADSARRYRAEVRRVPIGRAYESAWSDPSTGWPWPWPTSSGSDYAYTWHRGKVYVSWWGHKWCELALFRLLHRSDRGYERFLREYPETPSQFPVMDTSQVSLERSGMLVLSARPAATVDLKEQR